MIYEVRRTLRPAEMAEGKITRYPWGGDYRPRATFRLGHDGSRIRVLMRCEEAEPRALVTEYGGDVWCDSCMEFFLAPGREAADGYFNFEMNANGALLLHFGTSDETYVEVPRPDPSELSLEAMREEGWWVLDLTVAFSLIKRYMPTFCCAPGLIVHGNFYKCGDDTPMPHFGCFFPIDPLAVPQPNFHQPAYFGEIRLC